MDRILQKAQHEINGEKISVCRWQPGGAIPPPPTSSIEVQGFKVGTKADMMEMYFSNKKKAGGGAIKSVRAEGQSYIVTFDSEEGNCTDAASFCNDKFAEGVVVTIFQLSSWTRYLCFIHHFSLLLKVIPRRKCMAECYLQH